MWQNAYKKLYLCMLDLHILLQNIQYCLIYFVCLIVLYAVKHYFLFSIFLLFSFLYCSFIFLQNSVGNFSSLCISSVCLIKFKKT
jgi:hypothetical protein